ncbi:hypothetical protein [Pseudoneobacillus sp. C159]
MDKLKKLLRKNLLENPTIEIKHSLQWYLPILSYNVTFKRVRRKQMDILMKMILLTFELAEIRRAANLSELLLVEELFIDDLLIKMQRMGLVRLEKETYQLTSLGRDQLTTGIVLEDMEEESTFISHSPVHDEFWQAMAQPLPETLETLPLFRYANHHYLATLDRVLEVVSERENRLDEDGYQTVVAEMNSFTQQKIEQIPFLEFQIYNKEQDIFYARVWNTWLGRWDDKLEKQIEEKERLEWREKWMVVEEVLG